MINFQDLHSGDAVLLPILVTTLRLNHIVEIFVDATGHTTNWWIKLEDQSITSRGQLSLTHFGFNISHHHK